MCVYVCNKNDSIQKTYILNLNNAVLVSHF